MKEIALTQGKTALVDDCDFERLNRFKWFAVKSKNNNMFYAGMDSPRVNGKRHRIHMHHKVIGMPLCGFMADHKNGQGTDNRRKNLRFVTNRQNGQNRKGQKSSKYPGVSWIKANKKWRATIQIKGKIKHLGCFMDEKKASEVYRQAVNNLGETMVDKIQ